jgi:hypothetical protein
MDRKLCRRLSYVALALMLGAPRIAGASSIFEEAPPVLIGFDSSARSYAMGNNGGAVFWGDLAVRVNPALLGYADGIDYEQGTTASDGDPLIRTRETTLAHDGVGMMFAGQPFRGPDGARAEFSFDTAYGPSYDVYGLRTWSVGASAASLVQAWSKWRGGEAPAIFQHVDLAMGYAEDVGDDRSPGVPSLENREVTGTTGFLAKAGGVIPRHFLPITVQADVAYAYADMNSKSRERWLSAQDDVVGRLRWLCPEPWLQRMPGWLRPAMDPVVSLAAAYRWEHQAGGIRELGVGGELGLTRLFAVQMGQQSQGYGLPRNSDYTLRLPLGRMAEVRFQHAALPEARYRFDAWTVAIDPFAIARWMSHSEPAAGR